MKWQANSLDLTTLDFFLKIKIHATQPERLGDLLHRIENEWQQLNADVLSRKTFQNELYYCVKVNGTSFEQFI